MTQQNTMKKLSRMKIIYNGDADILDWMADLTDRTVFRTLDKFIKDTQGLHGALFLNCPADSVVVLILYKSPFAINNPGNNLMMYADNDIQRLMTYFQRLLDNTGKEKNAVNNALNDIMRLLYKEWIKIQDKSATLNRVD